MSAEVGYEGKARSTTNDDASRAADAKHGRTISVCISARNDASTIGDITHGICSELMDRVPVVDEVIVLDHGSTDDTAEIARRAGAVVIPTDCIAPEFGPVLGKGDVLWRSLQVAAGDIVVWLDGDLTLFTPGHVVKLVRPLLDDDRVVLVRAIQDTYENGTRTTGGRVAELTARPALNLLFPELAHIRQPLGGEQAVRRADVLALPFDVDEGVSVGLLIDVSRRLGQHSIHQVDLGARTHQEEHSADLYEQARQVLRAVLSRAIGESGASGAVQRPACATLPTAAFERVA